MNVASEAGRNVGAISSIESPNSGERKTIKKRATANKHARARTRVEYILCRRAVIPGPRENCNFLGRITFRTGPGPLLSSSSTSSSPRSPLSRFFARFNRCALCSQEIASNWFEGFGFSTEASLFRVIFHASIEIFIIYFSIEKKRIVISFFCEIIGTIINLSFLQKFVQFFSPSRSGITNGNIRIWFN